MTTWHAGGGRAGRNIGSTIQPTVPTFHLTVKYCIYDFPYIISDWAFVYFTIPSDLDEIPTARGRHTFCQMAISSRRAQSITTVYTHFWLLTQAR